MKRLALLLALIVPAGAAGADVPAVLWKVGPAPGGGRRVLFAPDAVLLSIARDPTFLPDLPETVAEEADGKVAHPLLDNGWACRTILSETERTVLLSGRGFQSVFVNGERRPGDVYRDGLLLLPVRLRAGENRILVRALRGDFTLALSLAEGEASLGNLAMVVGSVQIPGMMGGRIIGGADPLDASPYQIPVFSGWTRPPPEDPCCGETEPARVGVAERADGGYAPDQRLPVAPWRIRHANPSCVGPGRPGRRLRRRVVPPAAAPRGQQS